MLVAIAKPNRKKKDSSPFLQRMQPAKVMDSLLTRVLSNKVHFLSMKEFSCPWLAGTSRWLAMVADTTLQFSAES